MDKAQQAALVLRCRSGDRTAQEELVLAVQDTVYYHCRKMLRDPERAMDAAQEVLITMLTHLDTLREQEAFGRWLLQIVANRCRNELSRGPREEQIPENDQGESLLDTMAEPDSRRVPDDALDHAETREMIRKLVDGLPSPQRMCVLLYYYDELSIRQIAQVLQTSENTIKSRLHYARKAIQTGVKKYEKQGIKLYGAAPLGLLVHVLRLEAGTMAVPAAQANMLTASVLSAASGSAAAVAAAGGAAEAAASAATSAATSAAASTAAGSTAAGTAAVGAAAAAGGASGLTVKLVAGAIAAALAVGGTAVAVKQSQKEEPAAVTEIQQMEPEAVEPVQEEPAAPVQEEMEEPEDLAAVEENMRLLRESFDGRFPRRLPAYAADITGDGMKDVLVVDDSQPKMLTTVYLLTVENGQVASYPMITLPESGSFACFVKEDPETGYAQCLSYLPPEASGDGSSRFDVVSVSDGTVQTTPAFGVGGAFSPLTEAEWQRFDREAAETLRDAVPLTVFFDLRGQGLDCTAYGISEPDTSAIVQLGYPVMEREEEHGCVLSLPADWNGRFTIVRERGVGGDDLRIDFYCASNRRPDMPGIGELFSIHFSASVTEEMLQSEEYSSVQYLGMADGLNVYAQWPTDYRANPMDPHLTEEYDAMFGDVRYIVKHIRLDGTQQS